MASLFEDLLGFGGAEDAYKAQSQAYLKYAQEGERRSDRLLDKMYKSYDRVADQGYSAYDKSADRFNQGVREATEQYEPYADTSAYEKRQALSGALGQEAQEAAYSDYRESPGVAWLRERGMAGINRNAAATGGLGSGNRYKALSEFNQGLALQDFQNYWNRLGELSNTSFSAAQNLGNLKYSAGLAGSDLEERRGQFATGIERERGALERDQIATGDQRYLDAVIGTGEAKANKEIAEGNQWSRIGGAGLAAVGAGFGESGPFNWRAAGTSFLGSPLMRPREDKD